MNYGLVFPNFGATSDVRLLAEITREAESAGWHGIFLTDTIQMEGYEAAPVANPWIALTAMALATDNIRIGLRVAAPSRRPPLAAGPGSGHARSPLQRSPDPRGRHRGRARSRVQRVRRTGRSSHPG